jgi:hypothetical protein
MAFADLDRMLERVRLRAGTRAAASAARFADGARFRIEIPSVEGPGVLRAVLDEADERAVPVQRVSQGSGVMMLTDDEIREMVEMGADRGIEVCLFLGPRGAWDTGGQSLVTAAAAGVTRGADGLAWAVAEARRATALGIRSLLVADVGALAVLGELRAAGELPEGLIFKTSVLLPVANPATARVLDGLGAGTLNIGTDLAPAQMGEIRAATSLPIDVYIEVPDDQGGFVRFYEAADVIRAAAPVYLKLGIRNSPAIYPSGLHLADTAEKLARERVRRAELCLRLLADLDPELVGGARDARPPDLAVPEVT